MTATYDGDQFENVDRLMDCGVLPQIVEMIGSPESSVNATALLLASNLAFSGKKPVIQVMTVEVKFEYTSLFIDFQRCSS